MLFNSLQFAAFFCVVTAAYFLIPHRFRWLLLLASSCYFYMAFVPVYILILGFTIVVDYFAGIGLERARGRSRRIFLMASLVANIGVLAVFKYYNFLNDNLTLLLGGVGARNPMPVLTILLPIGLSFHTFQAMSYVIEVYRGRQKAERNFGIYALYVMFYPQLVAGPIERPQNLLPQFRVEKLFDYSRVTDGLKLMAWGLFKKIVIADRLGTIVDGVYDHPYQHHGLSLIIATVFFAFQIFCDFSGYSDIAIGAAQVMGFKLMKNFDRPYQARSVHEFWSRWHISLSTWFRDYLYIPLGGNRVTVPRWYFNLGVVFLVSGLWHGANWTFIIWGALHGFYLIFALMTRTLRADLSRAAGLARVPRLHNLLQTLTTFALVSFAWIFFRAKSVPAALYVVKSSLTGLPADLRALWNHVPLDLGLGESKTQACIAVLAIVFMEAVHVLQSKGSIRELIRAKPAPVRWGIYFASCLLIFFLGVFGDRQFIYFQF